MTERAEAIAEPAEQLAAHVLADLHDQARALAALGELAAAADHRGNRAERTLGELAAELETVRRELLAEVAVVRAELATMSRLLRELAELLPMARRAAALFDSPAARWAAPAAAAADGGRRARRGRRGETT